MNGATRTFGGGRPTTLPLAVLVVVAAPTLLVLGALLGATSSGVPGAVPDIPAAYLALYHQAASRFELGANGWSVLAAVGKVECDHGRSSLKGCHRGEANAAGARGPAQFLPATWATYGVDADGDGARDLYEPADAIFGMANYLRASGAPADWRRALFAYNHADWYVDQVLEQAAEYRASPLVTLLSPGALVAGDGRWLAPLPGFPGERCDARIIGDVVALVQMFGLFISDCFGGVPHAASGEHPLGLAIDASPSDGDWSRMERLARRFGWSESCATAGCPGVGPFRVVLYNGYPGHGDPRHSSVPHTSTSPGSTAAPPRSRARRGSESSSALPSPVPRGLDDALYALVPHSPPRSSLRERRLGLMADRLAVIGAVKDVKLDPKPGGLPGSEVLQGLVDGLAFWALLSALAALVVGAVIWAWASHAQNHQYTAGGRRAAGVAALAALLIGAAPALINFFAETGDKVR